MIEVQEEKLIIAIVQHKLWGYVLAPYIVVNNKDGKLLDIRHRLNPVDYFKAKGDYSESERKMLQLIFAFDDSALMKAYSKETLLNRFLDVTAKPIVESVIRPFIERKIADVIPLIQKLDIPIYVKDSAKTFFMSDRVQIIQGESEVVFNFNRTEEGITYHLNIEHGKEQISLFKKDLIVLVNKPCMVVLNNNMYIFDDIDSKKLSPFVERQVIEIPKVNEEAYFQTFIRKVLHQYKVVNKGFDIIEYKPKKQAVLSIEKGVDGKVGAVLKYFYDKAVYSFSTKSDERMVDLVRQEGEFVFHFSQRDKKWENIVVKDLDALGLTSSDNIFFSLSNAKAADEHTFVERIGLINAELEKKNYV